MATLVLQRSGTRGHPAPVAESNTILISGLERSASGGASLFGDANTTTITLGGGAAQGVITLGKTGVATNMPGFSNIGAATAATAANDFAFGNATTRGFWDDSANAFSIRSDSTGEGVYSYITEVTGRLQVLSEGAAGTIQKAINLYSFAQPSTIGNGSAITFAHATLSGGPVLSEMHSVATDITGGASESDLNFRVGKAGTPTQILQLRGTDLLANFAASVSVTTRLRVGGGIASATGDFSASDGTRSLEYDASAGSLTLAGAGTSLVAGDGTRSFTYTAATNRIDLLGGAAVIASAGNAMTIDSSSTMSIGASSTGITIGNVTGATALVYNAGTGGHAFTGKTGFFGATPVAQSAAYTVTNGASDRAYDANSTTLDELADVLGTLIADLKLLGVIG